MRRWPLPLNCTRYTKRTEEMKTQFTVFSLPYKVYPPEQIRRFRVALCKSESEFGDMFCVGVDLVKAWESKETSKRHRVCSGPAGRLMAIVEQMAAGKTANLIKWAAEGGNRNANKGQAA